MVSLKKIEYFWKISTRINEDQAKIGILKPGITTFNPWIFTPKQKLNPLRTLSGNKEIENFGMHISLVGKVKNIVQDETM